MPGATANWTMRLGISIARAALIPATAGKPRAFPFAPAFINRYTAVTIPIGLGTPTHRKSEHTNPKAVHGW